MSQTLLPEAFGLDPACARPGEAVPSVRTKLMPLPCAMASMVTNNKLACSQGAALAVTTFLLGAGIMRLAVAALVGLFMLLKPGKLRKPSSSCRAQPAAPAPRQRVILQPPGAADTIRISRSSTSPLHNELARSLRLMQISASAVKQKDEQLLEFA